MKIKIEMKKGKRKTITLRYDSNLLKLHLECIAPIKKLIVTKELTQWNDLSVGRPIYIAIASLTGRWKGYFLLQK
jgi:hypothetical protein